jgi:hypothetical protein
MAYNGWTNYETWRVNLEFFDGLEIDEYFTPETLKEMLEEHITEQTDNGLAQDYALAFINDVNYHEILESLKEE